MACANCGVDGLSTGLHFVRTNHQAEDMTSFVQPLVFDNTVTVLQGIEDLFDVNIDLKSTLKDLNGIMPQLCGFCVYLLAQAHQARAIFLKRSKQDSFMVKLVTEDSEVSQHLKRKRRRKQQVHYAEEDEDDEADFSEYHNAVVKQEQVETVEILMNENDSFDPLIDELDTLENDDQEFYCSECDQQFISSASFKRHMRSHENDAQYDPDPEDLGDDSSNPSDKEVPPKDSTLPKRVKKSAVSCFPGRKTAKKVSAILNGKYFRIQKIEGKSVTAKCVKCSQDVKCNLANTSNFLRHLKRKHPKTLEEYEEYKKSEALKRKGASGGTHDDNTSDEEQSQTTIEWLKCPKPVKNSIFHYIPNARSIKEITASSSVLPSIVNGKYFKITKVKGGSVVAKCMECSQEVFGTMSSTSNYVKHLKRKHVELAKEYELYKVSEQPKLKQRRREAKLLLQSSGESGDSRNKEDQLQ